MKNRKEIISLLCSLPIVKTATDSEILEFIERRNLMGLGLGLIDVHLLASTFLSKVLLWPKDKKRQETAKKLHACYI